MYLYRLQINGIKKKCNELCWNYTCKTFRSASRQITTSVVLMQQKHLVWVHYISTSFIYAKSNLSLSLSPPCTDCQWRDYMIHTKRMKWLYYTQCQHYFRMSSFQTWPIIRLRWYTPSLQELFTGGALLYYTQCQHYFRMSSFQAWPIIRLKWYTPSLQELFTLSGCPSSCHVNGPPAEGKR
jgi:hypothetical protein